MTPYSVTFTGDFFTMIVCVEVELDEIAPGDNPEEAAIDLATNIIEAHYGFPVREYATIDIVVEEG